MHIIIPRESTKYNNMEVVKNINRIDRMKFLTILNWREDREKKLTIQSRQIENKEVIDLNPTYQ